MSSSLTQLKDLESLSEAALLEILKNKCIDIPKIKSLKKSDLVEIFKRIAMPMPQRYLSESKHTEKKLSDLRKIRNIPIATEEEQTIYKSLILIQNKSIKKVGNENLKRSIEDSNSMSKKVCLSNSLTEGNNKKEYCVKHKLSDTEIVPQKDVKKRQKIMWP